MSKQWAVKLAEAMQSAGGPYVGGGLMRMKIGSTHPVTLLAYDQEISKYIYINPDYSPRSGDDVMVYQNGESFCILTKVVPV